MTFLTCIYICVLTTFDLRQTWIFQLIRFSLSIHQIWVYSSVRLIESRFRTLHNTVLYQQILFYFYPRTIGANSSKNRRKKHASNLTPSHLSLNSIELDKQFLVVPSIWWSPQLEYFRSSESIRNYARKLRKFNWINWMHFWQKFNWIEFNWFKKHVFTFPVLVWWFISNQPENWNEPKFDEIGLISLDFLGYKLQIGHSFVFFSFKLEYDFDFSCPWLTVQTYFINFDLIFLQILDFRERLIFPIRDQLVSQ